MSERSERTIGTSSERTEGTISTGSERTERDVGEGQSAEQTDMGRKAVITGPPRPQEAPADDAAAAAEPGEEPSDGTRSPEVPKSSSQRGGAATSEGTRSSEGTGSGESGIEVGQPQHASRSTDGRPQPEPAPKKTAQQAPKPTPASSSAPAPDAADAPTRYVQPISERLAHVPPRNPFDQATVRTEQPPVRTEPPMFEQAPPPAAPSTRVRPSRVPRRASLQLKHLDPWSVLKLSLVLSVAGFMAWMVAVGILYGVLDGMGVWDQLNGTYSDLTSVSEQQRGELISAGGVFGMATLIGAVNIVLFTAAATVGAFIYNVTSDLVGGVELTLSERD